MREKLVKIKLPPGLYRNGTAYQAKDRWADANLVRFYDGTIRPVGGWRRVQKGDGSNQDALTGAPRGAIAWRANDGTARVAFGTHSKLYALVEGVLYDITPAGFTAGSQHSTYAGGGGAYGFGLYGVGNYGTGSDAITLHDADTWQLDTFGDFLVACCTSDGLIYVWDGNIANVAVQATDSPEDCVGLVVTPERFLVAIGADGDIRTVAWASRETTETWAATSTNTAGDFPLASNGRLRAGRRTRRQTLLWTDVDMYTMTYIGGQFIYQFDQGGDNCGLIAPNAVAIVDTVAYWMGKGAFFRFNGFTEPVPCEVSDYVFGDFNSVQAAKVFAVPVSEFGEVWWFYPSAGSLECDRYVVYNYRENHWTTGELQRSAGVDRGAIEYPIFVTSSGLIYEHEVLHERSGADAPYLESGPFELGEGDQVVRVQRLVPDERTLGDVQARFFTSFYPTETEVERGPYTLDEPTDVRFTARQARLRLEEVEPTSWRVGVIRLGVIPGGRR